MTSRNEAVHMLLDGINGIVEAIPRIVEIATAAERAAVVAWLRESGGGVNLTDSDSYGDAFASAIERGEHRRKEDK